MKQENASDRLMKILQQPQQAYRPIPFWSWNDALMPDELRRQIVGMKKSGVGGYFMHARGGLQTEYLGKSWFDSVEIGITEGEKNALLPWIYDEEGWPSGFGGGRVTALGEWTYARGLRMRRIERPTDAVQDASLLGVFACTEQDAQAVPIAQMRQEETYTSYLEITHSCSPFYIDVMNAKVVRAFLDCTHEEYAKRFVLGGKTGLQGFFTDEPRFSEGAIPWSYLLPTEFEARYGVSLLDSLPALYLPCRGYRAVRHRFWSMVNDLFVNAYMRQISEWCEQHHCKLTGHMMMEESLYSQMTGTGGGMPFYEWMHQPGVDSLRRAVNDPRIPKQVGSVAEQLGKKQVISESYAMCGWDLNFDEMRWIAGWQYVNGVNLICQHLQAYSLKGMRKRDYPPSLYYQQTWYDEYYRFNDYLARLGQMLSQGKKCIDVLMLHPMHSGWVSYDGTNNDEIKQLDADFVNATQLFAGAHVDYHLGDEIILRRHGKVLSDGRIQVGAYAYGAVVMPSALSVDANTVSILKRFSASGRPILSVGQWPLLCEGEASAVLTQLQAQVVSVHTAEQVRAALCKTITHAVDIRENEEQAASIHCCQVELSTGGIALYLINMAAETAHSTKITLPGNVSVYSLA
ncbi:MAG: glycosyl hydrolase, partial [Ruthenibacterium sp.]